MTAIPPIGSGINPVVTNPIGPGADAASGATEATKGFDLAGALDNVAGAQMEADALGQAVATGDAADIHDFTAAASKASLAMELTVAVRDKAVEAYQQIINMQV